MTLLIAGGSFAAPSSSLQSFLVPLKLKNSPKPTMMLTSQIPTVDLRSNPGASDEASQAAAKTLQEAEQAIEHANTN